MVLGKYCSVGYTASCTSATFRWGQRSSSFCRHRFRIAREHGAAPQSIEMLLRHIGQLDPPDITKWSTGRPTSFTMENLWNACFRSKQSKQEFILCRGRTHAMSIYPVKTAEKDCIWVLFPGTAGSEHCHS